MKIFLLAFLQVPLFFTTGNLPATCNPASPSYFLKMSDFKVYTCTTSGNYSVVATPADQIATQIPSGPGGIPAGAVLMILSGACPAGYSESAVLNGKMLRGTVAAAGNVGQTGGVDLVTPTTSSVSLNAAAQAFTGTPFTSVINHTHPVVDPGHNHIQNSHNHIQDAHTHVLTGGATDDTSAPFPGPDAANAATAFAATGISSTVATNQASTAVNQSSTTGISTANPAGGVASITPAGTNSTSAVSGTVTLNQFDNRPSYLNVIFCVKS